MAPANYHERQNRAPGKMLLHGKQLRHAGKSKGTRIFDWSHARSATRLDGPLQLQLFDRSFNPIGRTVR
jgi:hypothetical protein